MRKDLPWGLGLTLKRLEGRSKACKTDQWVVLPQGTWGGRDLEEPWGSPLTEGRALSGGESALPQSTGLGETWKTDSPSLIWGEWRHRNVTKVPWE